MKDEFFNFLREVKYQSEYYKAYLESIQKRKGLSPLEYRQQYFSLKNK